MRYIEEQNGKSVVYTNDGYNKHNSLISAKYKASLIENKIMAISLSKIDEAFYEEVPIDDGTTTKVLTSEIKGSEIASLLGLNEKSVARQLDQTANRMTGRTIGIKHENGEFRYSALIIQSEYVNGKFKIHYNPLLDHYYHNLQKNYTPFSLHLMMKFKHTYSYRLYEILKSRSFLSKKDKKEQSVSKDKSCEFRIQYSLAELKFELGCANAELSEVKSILTDKKGPNYDKALNETPEKKYEKWGEFKRSVLDVAINEINDITEMHVEAQPQKSGRGGKVYGVVFAVSINQRANRPDENLDEKAKIDTEDMVREMLAEEYPTLKLKTMDIRSICEAAAYDMARIETAYQVLLSQKNPVGNVVGFLITAIRDEYVPCEMEATEEEIIDESGDAFEEVIFEDSKEEIDKESVKNKVSALFDDELSVKDIRTICETANYDYDIVRKAWDVMNSYTGEIQSITGFMIRAIQNGYEVNKKAATKRKRVSGQQPAAHEHNWDDLEIQLLMLAQEGK